MRSLLAVALLLAACSSDPVLLPDAAGADASMCPATCLAAGGVCAAGSCVYPPIDSGRADVGSPDAGMDVPDVGRDVVSEGFPTEHPVDVQTPDVPFDDGLPHDGCGIVDGACYAPTDVPPDMGVPDGGAPEDRPDAMVCDTGPCTCPDGRSGNYTCLSEWCVCTGPLDAGVDVVDAGSDTGVDVPGDRPDVVDGPADVGGVVYDLEAARTGVEYRGLYRRTITGGSISDCTSVPTMTSCSVTSGTLRFALQQCGVDFVGEFTTDTASTRALSIAIGGAGHFASNPALTAGRRNAGSPARRSFHVQYARPVDGARPGAAGIPGRTVDPALGDIWILGCPTD